MQPFLGSSTVFTCKCTYLQLFFLTMPMDEIGAWELCAVRDDCEIGDQLPHCREYWQRVSENNAMKITSAMYTPPGTMMLDFTIFVMRNGRSFKYHIDPSSVGQAIQKWRPVNPAQDAIIARPRSPRHFVYDIMLTPDFTDYFTIKVAYAVSGGTAALIHYPKDKILYAMYLYRDLFDRLMDDNIITAITRITVSTHAHTRKHTQQQKSKKANK